MSIIDSNINPPTFPDGFDVEIIKLSALKKSYENITSKFDKEHVTTHIASSKVFQNSI